MAYVEVQDENGKARIELPPVLTAKEGGRRFALGSAIRGGGNGVVFRATTEARTGDVAVKVLRQLYGSRVDRFENEVRILANEVRHPRVSAYFGHGQHIDPRGWHVPWVAIELGGDNLRVHVERHGPLDGRMLRGAVASMCDALDAVHAAGFIHRDVKPDNFVLRADASDLMMIDFGIAKRLSEDVSARPLDSFTRQQEFVGPMVYSSPELIAYSSNKAHPVDHKSDLFQLGKVIWYAATGTTTAGVPSRRQDPTGGGLHAVMLELIADAPEDRPATATVVKEMVLSTLSR